ncbi:MAG: ABC transporter ATP-binding protein [Candidatus Cloacimonetes bacterium]|nr:ABC transporter ATP-binding protein [Candidatus Cloacimonadota bacterium]
MKALQTVNLNKSFGELQAVKDLNLEVNPGEIFGFLGPNGAGKSTTLKMVTGLLKPCSGDVFVFGRCPVENNVEVKFNIGVVAEELQMYDRLTGAEFVEFSARMYGIDQSVYEQRMNRYFSLLDLEARKDSFIMDYSTGMKKKLSLIVALVHGPKLLLLDEPFTGMDALSVIRVKELLNELKSEGVAIIFSSHILEIVEKVCDRIGIIQDGALKAVGRYDQLLEDHGFSTLDMFFTKDKTE